MGEIIANIKKDIPLTGYKQIIQVEGGHIDCNLKDGRYYINISYFSRPRYDTFYDSFIENYPLETERFTLRIQWLLLMGSAGVESITT